MMSGVAGYGMSTSSVASYNSKKTMTQSADTTGTTYYGYVKDKAGNINNCNVGVKKDTKAPTCSVKGSGTKGNNDWYRSNVNVYLNYSDSGSGINNYGLSTSLHKPQIQKERSIMDMFKMRQEIQGNVI